MSIRFVAGVLALTALLLSGCVPTSTGSGSVRSDSGAQSGERLTAMKGSGAAERASAAALDALGAKVVDTHGDYLLCSLVDHYKMCGGEPCHKGGLRATTYFVCRQNNCAGIEVPTPNMPTYRSHNSCKAGCKRAQSQYRAKKVRDETFYCTY